MFFLNIINSLYFRKLHAVLALQVFILGYTTATQNIDDKTDLDNQLVDVEIDAYLPEDRKKRNAVAFPRQQPLRARTRCGCHQHAEQNDYCKRFCAKKKLIDDLMKARLVQILTNEEPPRRERTRCGCHQYAEQNDYCKKFCAKQKLINDILNARSIKVLNYEEPQRSRTRCGCHMFAEQNDFCKRFCAKKKFIDNLSRLLIV